MIKAIIIDDEKNAIEALRNVIADFDQIEIVGTFINPLKALEQMRELTHHVVFLDIEMPGIQGLEMAEKILELDRAHQIVFITAYDQYAVEAFEVNAIDYLLKPVRRERMAKTIEKLLGSSKIFRENKEPYKEGRITCFGAFQLQLDPEHGKEVKWRTNKARELFAYLVHHRRKSVHKEKIIADLWPDMEIERAIVYLHSCIYQIRKVIKRYGLDEWMKVEYHGHSYLLVMDGISCDSDEFVNTASSIQEITQEKILLYERAATLYRGHYFEENDYPWANEFKQQLFMYHIKMLKKMAAFYMEEGMYTEAVLRLKQLLANEPLQEECHEMLLICYAQTGERAALAAHFEGMRKLYLEEVGIEVRPSTQALYEELSARLK
jgi:two-component system, LytTR family, response regulator